MEEFVPVVVAVLVIVLSALFLFVRKSNPIALNPSEFQKFRLVKKESISHDTRRFTVALQSPRHKLGLPIGQHISIRFTDKDGRGHQRSYTPVTGDETLGKVVFVIKVYKAGVHPKYPEGGKLSQHLDSLEIGDHVEMKGPKGHLTWLGEGNFNVKLMRKPLVSRYADRIGMIAGGTGITPMLQILTAIFSNPADRTEVKMIFANQTEDDILVRKELEDIASKYPDRFKLHYTLDRPPGNWGYSTGFVNKEMIKEHLYSPEKGKNTQIFMCGPPPMIKFACLPNLEALGFSENEWFSF